MKRTGIIIVFMLLLFAYAKATTWKPVIRECPICQHQSTYFVINSYGGYIYNWPSKYQYVFWPYIDSNYLYCCPHCRFTAFLCDFSNIPDEKIPLIKAKLFLTFPNKEEKRYCRIPMTTRLKIAEKVYQALGRDTEFWCTFYRIAGFHYQEEGHLRLAKKSRMKSIKLAKRLFNDPQYGGQEKELLVILSSMYNFTDQKDSSLFYLEKAKSYNYTYKVRENDDPSTTDGYLNELIPLYEAFIQDDRKNTQEY